MARGLESQMERLYRMIVETLSENSTDIATGPADDALDNKRPARSGIPPDMDAGNAGNEISDRLAGLGPAPPKVQWMSGDPFAYLYGGPLPPSS